MNCYYYKRELLLEFKSDIGGVLISLEQEKEWNATNKN